MKILSTNVTETVEEIPIVDQIETVVDGVSHLIPSTSPLGIGFAILLSGFALRKAIRKARK